MADELNYNDPLKLPFEIAQAIIDYLPLCDTWRLRTVCRTWNEHLSGDDALRAAARRWNSRCKDGRAALRRHPETTYTQDLRRMKSFLSGRPIMYATISTPEITTMNHLCTMRFRGEWLAYNAHPREEHPVLTLHNLLSGRVWKFDMYRCYNLDFVLTADMISYPGYVDGLRLDSKPHNALITMRFDDFSIMTTPLDDSEHIGDICGQIADGLCVATFRHYGDGSSPERCHVQIHNYDNGKKWTFDMVDSSISCPTSIDACNEVLTMVGTGPSIKSLAINDPDRELTDGITRLDIKLYSFSGVLLNGETRQIPQACREYLHSYAGAQTLAQIPQPVVHALPFICSTSACLDALLQNKRAARSHNFDGNWCYASGYGMKWKDMVCHASYNERLLYVSRSVPDDEGLVRILTSCDTNACIPAGQSTSAAISFPQVKAVNESFMIITHGTHLVVFAFDELACGQVEGESSSLTWKSAEGVFRDFRPRPRISRRRRLSREIWPDC